MHDIEKFFEGANLVTPIEPDPNPLRLEDVLAMQRNTTPADCVNDAMVFRQNYRETGIACCISQNPIDDPASMFNGHYEIILMSHSPVYGDIERRVYLTPEQHQKGRGSFKVPREGIFIRDEEQWWYETST